MQMLTIDTFFFFFFKGAARPEIIEIADDDEESAEENEDDELEDYEEESEADSESLMDGDTDGVNGARSAPRTRNSSLGGNQCTYFATADTGSFLCEIKAD